MLYDIFMFFFVCYLVSFTVAVFLTICCKVGYKLLVLAAKALKKTLKQWAEDKKTKDATAILETVEKLEKHFNAIILCLQSLERQCILLYVNSRIVSLFKERTSLLKEVEQAVEAEEFDKLEEVEEEFDASFERVEVVPAMDMN